MAAIVAAPRPAIHQRPAEGEAHDLLGIERVLWFLRIAGFLVVASQAPLYQLVTPVFVVIALAIVGVAIVVQPRWLSQDLPYETLRGRAIVLLVADIAAIYLFGTVFAADSLWVAFYFYPLLVLDATIVAGVRAGVVVTLLNIAVYVAQLAVQAELGLPVDPRAATVSVAMLLMTGAFMAAFGSTAERGRRDLRVLLELTSALARQRNETETIELLDRRLNDAIGGRVRSIAIRQPDGSFEILRWHADSRRMLPREALDRVLGDVDALGAVFLAGEAVTYQADQASGLGPALGLPDWTRALTLVPVFVEDRWTAVLPVLWSIPTTPSGDQLRLLYGLANQVGLALAQGQLQRVRAEAATDALTGLLNRRAVLNELDAYVARANRSGGRLAVLFCDLDAFKGVNDRGGHEAGDQLLRAVAVRVLGAVRQGDVVGRIGGDELLVVAADAAETDARTLAARLGEAVREATAGEGVDVTIGVARYPDDAATSSELVTIADRAMYQGKLLGAGSVVVGLPRADASVTASA
jgi:diguanylate cyclase (GGDEF)-like protein